MLQAVLAIEGITARSRSVKGSGKDRSSPR
jgi:hypothetical protein